MNVYCWRIILALALVFFILTSSAQSQNKVVVIPLESTRPAIEIVDNKGLTIGAATAANFVAMRPDATLRGRRVFLLPISRQNFFTSEVGSSAGVLYTGPNCTGIAFTFAEPEVFEMARVGFDPDEGPHPADTEINEIHAFIRADPDSPSSRASSSAALFLDNTGWVCDSIFAIGSDTYDLQMVRDLSVFDPPYNAVER